MNFNHYQENFSKILQKVATQEVEAAVEIIIEKYNRNHNIFLIGNGGSAANASHFAQDLAKGVFPRTHTGRRIRAFSLTDNTPYISAVANDDGYERIFEAQLNTFANKDDLLIVISGSGNSRNIICALEYARSKGLSTLGFSGFDGGKMKNLLDSEVHISLHEMCTVESVHSVIFHYIVLTLRQRLANIPFDEACLKVNSNNHE